ncbi:MAG: primosomal protein N' [Clostridia bacterium]|nr:primosomal protein N' [Clostridia bacterium]NCD02713.1 primosomal protein N' [Clostridia bacterium]
MEGGYRVKYADIIIDISLEALDRVFQYLIPEELQTIVRVGSQVMVPFGNGNRLVKGYIVGFSEETDYDVCKMKSIQELAKNSMTVESQMISLADWMSRMYGCTRAQALKTVLNVKRRIKGGTKRVYRLAVPPEAAEIEMKKLALQPRFASRAAILALMLDDTEHKGISEAVFKKKVPSPENALRTLMKHGWIEVQEESDYRVPFSGISGGRKVELNSAQIKAVEDIWNDERQIHLLYGVTGSGKTEVYMSLIERVIQSGKQAIVLIPEISLTYQNIARFRQRFGQRVSVMNSKMSDGERYDQYIQAENGEIDIMIGPRSALFTPFPRLGMIIIDEEQDGAYKSDTTPKYHALDVAIQRTAMEGGRVVLGSATPSVVSYDRAVKGIYSLHKLPERVAGGTEMASVEVIDLREELKEKNYSIFSRRLQEEMQQRLERKEQILLFLNRRGYAGFISCRSCGHVIRCPHCDVSMTLHKSQGNILKCHYCGNTVAMPKTCPECGSKYIGAFGMGTEKVVEMLKSRFPQARILRADRDSMGKKNSALDIFQAFAKGEADILVGTQMIVKGHDFPNVTLVGILAADLSMFSGDYLAGERTFQLLTQAAGRTGRGEKKGLAIIQTYKPDHYAVLCAAEQNYEAFYKQEILYRKLMHYPPAGYMMAVVVEHEQESSAGEAAGILAEAMKKEAVILLPPADGFRAKEKDVYRKVIYIKSPGLDELLECRSAGQKVIREMELFKQMNIQFDINPVNLY